MNGVITSLAILLGVLNIYYFIKCQRLKEHIDYCHIIFEQFKPTDFIYEVDTARMISSEALVNLFGGYTNNGRDKIMENFPQAAVDKGNVHPYDAERFLAFYKSAKEGELTEGNLVLRIRDDGLNRYVWASVYLKTLTYKKGKPNRILGIISDLSYVDRITGLPNKTKFIADAQELIEHCEEVYTLGILDLKNFKRFNDIHGYEQGDQLLKHIADILLDEMHDNEVCAYFSADKFLLLIHYTSKEAISMRIQAICERIKVFVVQEDLKFTIEPRAGLLTIDKEVANVVTAMDQIRFAQINGKGEEEGTVTYFDNAVGKQIKRNIELEKRMETALRLGEFKVYIQPQYHLKTRKIVGAEALVRWQYEGTMVSPGEFIPLFEQNRFITKLDYYVFEEACKQMRSWLDEGMSPIKVAVNFSRRHLYNPLWAEELAEIADKWQVPRGLLEVELTESIAFENEHILIRVLDRLNELGFRVAMDDFGMGYSSLGMLKNLRFATIKLDRSFFGDFDDKERTMIIVKIITTLAKQLDGEVVVEGIEYQEQVDSLVELDDIIAQGYYFARPMPEEAFKAFWYQEETSKGVTVG